MGQNKILDSSNNPVAATILGESINTIHGLPMGTVNGEVGVKVVAVGGSSGSGSATGILIPNSDYVSYTYYGATNNVQTAVYKLGGSGGTTVATLTYTYVGGGASNNDIIQTVTKS